MLLRIAPALALVFAMLVLPGVSALGEEVAQVYDGYVVPAYEQTAAAYEQVANDVNTWLSPPPQEPGQPVEPEPAPPAESPPSHGSHDGHHSAPPPAPEEGAPSPLAPLAPIQRLVPVPITQFGPAPRIDLAVVTAAVTSLTQEAPQPTAPASAPVETASIEAAPVEIASTDAAPLADAMVLGVAAAATVSAPVAASLWERLRRLGWLALLYSRIAKERLLDHGSRERLLDTIRARPGLAVADIADAMSIPRNTVTYHLRVLERERLVSSTRNGRNRLFFAPGSLPQRANADALATLRHETTLAVAREIGANPGVDQKGICARIGLSPSLAHWHADRLVATGLVDKRRDGRNVRYYPGAAFEVVASRA